MRRRKKVDYYFPVLLQVLPVVVLVLSLIVANDNNKNVALLFVGATIEISCSLNPSLSGVYVRGVLPGHEDAFVKAAAATAAAAAPNDDGNDDEKSSSLFLWLYRKDRGMDGFRWFIGNDVASDSALAFFDTWSMLPCGQRSRSSSATQGSSWMVTGRNGEWLADPAFTIRYNGLDPGGVDACSGRHGELVVPCVNLTGSGASPVPMPVVMLGTAYLSASHGAGAAHPEAIERAPAIDVALDDDDDKGTTGSRPGYSGLDLGSQLHPAYANERLVGSLLAARPGRRKSLFLTTKLAPSEHGYNSTLRAFQRSLRLLRTDTIDLYLIHHPQCRMAETCEGDWVQSWRALERLLAMGAARAIGVSNFDYELLAYLVGGETSEKNEGGHNDARTTTGIARAPVSLIQNRADPLAPEDPRVLALCRKRAIQYQAYSALGRQWVVGPWSKYWKRDHPILSHPDVVAIADRISNEIIIRQHQSELVDEEHRQQQPPVVRPAQVILRWALQKGWAVVPKTSRADRLRTNRELFHFELTERDVNAIDHLEAPRITIPEERQRFEEL